MPTLPKAEDLVENGGDSIWLHLLILMNSGSKSRIIVPPPPIEKTRAVYLHVLFARPQSSQHMRLTPKLSHMACKA